MGRCTAILWYYDCPDAGIRVKSLADGTVLFLQKGLARRPNDYRGGYLPRDYFAFFVWLFGHHLQVRCSS